MIVSYPALFYKDPEGGYFVYFPDIKGVGTQGDDISDAMFMASDYLGIMLADLIESKKILPKASNINDLSLIDDNPFKNEDDMKDYYNKKDSFISMVFTDLEKYFESKKLVKKTLSIPKWANDLGNRLNLNFSKVLTNAIKEKYIKDI